MPCRGCLPAPGTSAPRSRVTVKPRLCVAARDGFGGNGQKQGAAHLGGISPKALLTTNSHGLGLSGEKKLMAPKIFLSN